MDLLYFIIFIVITMIDDIETVLLKKTDLKSFSNKRILFESEEPSLLQCAQRCKFRDGNAIVDYKDTTCRCISNEDHDEDNDPHTLSGLFINEKIVKMETEHTTEKPRTYRLMNVAFNKSAEQSSTYANYAAKNAIDGYLSTRSCTKEDYNQWWSVDLKDIVHVTQMIFKGGAFKSYDNRALIVETRQKQEDPWSKCKLLGKVARKTLKFECDQKTSARYVKIRSTERCFIDIGEFEIYAYKPFPVYG